MMSTLKHLIWSVFFPRVIGRCFSTLLLKVCCALSVVSFIRPKRYMVATLIATIALSGTICEAQLYKCRDRKGRLNITNVPSSPDCIAYLNTKSRIRSWRGKKVSYDSAKYDDDIVRIGKLYRVDPKLIKAIIHTESDFDHRAVSKSGAQGLMQLMPETAKELRVTNPFNPRENIDGGTRYIKWLLKTFDGDLILSIAAYNAGPTPVREANGIPQIPETVRYVKKVLRHYKAYKAAS